MRPCEAIKTPGFCVARQGRVLTALELKGKGVLDREFCKHKVETECKCEDYTKERYEADGETIY